uniref:Uncharacterized protein n=1 Tax=viral metagenome TaxID=1070528 RepID=A0A6C0IH69_9ZZZZ
MANILYSSEDEYEYEDYEQHLGGKCKQHINNASAVKTGAKKPLQQENLQEKIKAKQLKIQQNKQRKEAEQQKNTNIKEPTIEPTIVKKPEVKTEREVLDDWEDFM